MPTKKTAPPQQPLEIVYRDLDDLKPSPGNARTHSAAQLDVLARSIRRFGFTNPVLVDERGGILAGHGRVLAARRAGIRSVPTVVLSHMTDEQKRAYMLADNQIALQSGWDEEMLAAEIKALCGLGFDVADLGFDTKALASELAASLRDHQERDQDEGAIGEEDQDDDTDQDDDDGDSDSERATPIEYPVFVTLASKRDYEQWKALVRRHESASDAFIAAIRAASC